MVSRIRNIATSCFGSIAAAAEFQRTIYIWDVVSGKKICQFESIFDSGERRLAISEDGKLCAAGAYHREGIALYDATSGDALWQRKDLRKAQILTFSRWFGGSIVACFDGKPCHVLDCCTGKTLHKIKGVREFAESSYNNVQLLGKTRYVEVVDFEKQTVLRKIPRSTFSMLDSAFSKNHLAISEVAGPVRCCRINGGEQLWQYVSEHGSHVLRLEYCEATDEVLGIHWSYEKGGEKRLVAIDINTGKISREDSTIGCPVQMAFAVRGSVLITSDGEIIDTTNGKIAGELNFPRMDDIEKA